MLIHNIDVLDGLSNGAQGTLGGIETNRKKNEIQVLMKNIREQANLAKKHPSGTPIKKILYSYSFTKKTIVAGSRAQVFSFHLLNALQQRPTSFKVHQSQTKQVSS